MFLIMLKMRVTLTKYTINKYIYKSMNLNKLKDNFIKLKL